MRRSFLLVVLPVSAAGGCGESPTAAAVGTFARFQDALFAGDRAELRALVTRDSRPAVDALPLDRVAGQQPVRVTGCERIDAALFHVHVADPNAGGRASRFVVVKENGVLRVDLLDTTAFNHRDRWLDGPALRQTVRPLSPAERAVAEAAARRRDSAEGGR